MFFFQLLLHIVKCLHNRKSFKTQSLLIQFFQFFIFINTALNINKTKYMTLHFSNASINSDINAQKF